MNLEPSTKEMSQTQSRGRKVLIVLAVIFILPFTIAVALHFLDIRPGGKSYGDLITPPVSLAIPDLQDVAGKDIPAMIWQKKWSVVAVEQASCNDICLADTHMLRQVHISLGKESDRVQRIALFPSDSNSEDLLNLQKDYPDLIIFAGGSEGLTKFRSQFKAGDNTAGIYLVDPLGNLMMYYPHDFEPKGLRKDLTRLLKNSWAG